MSSQLEAAVNLNTPSTYLHWSIFYVSLANLLLIAAMVVIFAAALARYPRLIPLHRLIWRRSVASE
jgi:hypothetical protein